MTDQERIQWNELKHAAVGRWSREVAGAWARLRSEPDATDRRIGRYVDAVMASPADHNLYEILGVMRYVDLLGRWRWNSKRVRRFVKLYELLRFNGDGGRRRYQLTPVQAFQFSSIFGFDNERGERLTRVAYLFIPRKFGKTTSVAALAVNDMLFGDDNSQAYVGANSYEQAKICFNEIRAIMRDLDPGENHFRVNREKITWMDGSRDGFIRCLTANARTQDGLNASLVIMDEYAQARDTSGKNGSDLKNTLTSSMGARREPLTVVITTASEVIDGPFVRELEGVKAILRGETDNDTVFASLFMPDVDDDDGDPRTWRKVQPHLGVTVREGSYAEQWAQACLSADNMMNFRTKLLNIFTVNERRTWFTWEQTAALMGDFDIDRVAMGTRVTVAFDLSVKDDFSAVSYVMYSASVKKFYCHTDYYFPEGQLQGHPNEQLYRAWIRQGHLQLCPGKCIDVNMIAEDILRRSERVVFKKIGFDNYKARELVNLLKSAGAANVLEAYSQRYGNFNLPVESMEMLVLADPPGIEFNRNPITAYCFSNCLIDEDHMENKKPIKIAEYRKIDGAVTALMGLGMIVSYSD